MPAQPSPETVALVKATVPALAEHGASITEAMYRRLFRDPEIAALFNDANQKSGAQRFALAGAVLAYAQNIDNLGALAGAVERMAQKHVGYAILPEHYPHVATALLGAIEEVLGDAATPQILAAWGEAYWFLAEILKEREAAIRAGILAQPGGWTGWRRFAIIDRRAESDTIMSFTLRPEDGGPVIAHRPGQYLTLRFDAAGRPGIKRNYTISCGPNRDHYRITVKREPRGEASCFLHDDTTLGTVLECTPPAGDFHLPAAPRRPVVLLSGGVGLTPMVSMMEEIAAHHPDLPVYYVHGTTGRATHALDPQIRHLARRHGRTTVATFYEQPDPAGGANDGLITLDWLRDNVPLSDADIYLCGPKPFLRHFVSGLVGEGIPASRIHYEFFGPADEVLAA
ncbi:NO-inducible flavohemoprotein [Paracoccus siganidrum]|uniref:nitric oxide dioxygenase n=1 Tax=Paracoccus siganidrum TaxID=1276757 RepID=A0A419ABP0_9RHOB|nr:NO-inducible flavohemoprotein [Paracoccus siganidrum]RJL21165.1 NO-inducible flavohemoprotein [Paracoccus siganidrum]RMC40512.1 NO-inducible flavohemoprotein [Paracoccus siganidrum]